MILFLFFIKIFGKEDFFMFLKFICSPEKETENYFSAEDCLLVEVSEEDFAVLQAFLLEEKSVWTGKTK